MHDVENSALRGVGDEIQSERMIPVQDDIEIICELLQWR